MDLMWTQHFIQWYTNCQEKYCLLPLARIDGTSALRGLDLDLTILFMNFVLHAHAGHHAACGSVYMYMRSALEERALVAHSRTNQDPHTYLAWYLAEHHLNIAKQITQRCSDTDSEESEEGEEGE